MAPKPLQIPSPPPPEGAYDVGRASKPGERKSELRAGQEVAKTFGDAVLGIRASRMKRCLPLVATGSTAGFRDHRVAEAALLRRSRVDGPRRQDLRHAVDEDHMNVMLEEGGIRSAVHSEPETCEEVWWGKRLAAVCVDLRRVDAEMLANLLEDAWESKAPRRLLDDLPGEVNDRRRCSSGPRIVVRL